MSSGAFLEKIVWGPAGCLSSTEGNAFTVRPPASLQPSGSPHLCTPSTEGTLDQPGSPRSYVSSLFPAFAGDFPFPGTLAHPYSQPHPRQHSISIFRKLSPSSEPSETSLCKSTSPRLHPPVPPQGRLMLVSVSLNTSL